MMSLVVGNPYLECFPPTPEEADFLSFNSTNLFVRRTGDPVPMEQGHLRNSEVFPEDDSDEDSVIVDERKK